MFYYTQLLKRWRWCWTLWRQWSNITLMLDHSRHQSPTLHLLDRREPMRMQYLCVRYNNTYYMVLVNPIICLCEIKKTILNPGKFHLKFPGIEIHRHRITIEKLFMIGPAIPDLTIPWSDISAPLCSGKFVSAYRRMRLYPVISACACKVGALMWGNTVVMFLRVRLIH